MKLAGMPDMNRQDAVNRQYLSHEEDMPHPGDRGQYYPSGPLPTRPVFLRSVRQVWLIVWAEIPYISEHMPSGRENTISQMTELIVQNYNHPSIVCWGVSNEITISTKNKRDMLDNHRR